MFRIWCEVWGGVTGSRAAWLKQNGEIADFATREAAEAEAARLNDRTKDNPRASFSYSVRECGAANPFDGTTRKSHRATHKGF